MALNYEAIMNLRSEDQPFAYTERDTMLYALGVGMASDPLDAGELPFAFENGLKVLPTQTTIMAWSAGRVSETGLNFLMVVHGEQRLRIHAPLSPAADLLADWRVAELIDKGEQKGAVLVTETVLKTKQDRSPLATLTSTIFARGDGGFGGPSEGGLTPHALPDRAPDSEVALTTRPDQALLYRLSGDRNALHADPGFAQAAGFPRPILHGLCTYAIACRAVLQTYCDYDPAMIVGHDARFSAPVFPGETIVTNMWRDGAVVSFEARVAERPNVVVVKNGRTELAA